MESVPHYNSKEKYGFTTLTSVLDIILIYVRKQLKEKKIPLLSTNMITCLGNQKNLGPSQIHVKSKPQHDCSDRAFRISVDSPGQWVGALSHSAAIFTSRGKKILMFRLCHMKVTACQEESTPEAKHAVILFSCVCMSMLVFPHLQMACGIQKVRSGFPGHFPFYLLKQGLLLNPKLVESNNLTTKSPEESHLPPKLWDYRQPPWPPGTQSLWENKLWSSRLQGKSFALWTISLAPMLLFLCEKINCLIWFTAGDEN